MNPYIGHETQLSGVEEHRLVGGKGDGMRLYEARPGTDTFPGQKRRYYKTSL